MAAITTTGTLTAGNSRTFALAPGSALTLTLLPNCRVTVTETPETVSASDAGGNSPRTHNHQFAGVFTYGPYVMGGSVVVDNASNSGSTVTWGRKDTTVSTSSDGLSLVSGDGNELVRFANPGADKLDAPVQHMESTDAMSTTVTVRMAPTGTYRTARVSWVNNGASGSAKLNIAANCSNDVSGLVASQSSLQRDYQLTMAGSILLVSPVPITSLNFSSDVSITADTHRLVVTFGA